MPDAGAAGLIIAAPSSGSGKTVITLSLLRALKNAGVKVGSFKIGPDYIDPAYHAAASGQLCRNLDFWAMREETLANQIAAETDQAEIIITEGVMGLFDGASTGSSANAGSTADAAKSLDWPVVLVIDAKAQAASVAALVEGFTNHRDDIDIAAVIFNRIGGPGHETILREAIEPTGIACLGCIPRNADLELPSRHLGLIQAKELPKLDQWLDAAASNVAAHVDLKLLTKIARHSAQVSASPAFSALSALGKHTAIARDDAFAFCYDHIIDGWREAGTEISFFSPLAGEAPDPEADSIYLPGGYPELHAAEIAGNHNFFEAMANAVTNGAVVYGECGGFMVLGETLTDGDGRSHDMLGLLPIKTSFAAPKLHLGYRQLSLIDEGALGAIDAKFKAHEFHYCELTATGDAGPLFIAKDARGGELAEMGCRVGRVMGSFAHIIDRV
ncbi:MAG: cobyrinate a,c-diamide synthase [Rhodospirillales bacterium]|jgi:cobyrinic acid a,c-diamide synthase